MTHETLLNNEDWARVVERLGGAEELAASARRTGAFRRARVIPSAVALLRLILAYCLGERGLRSTTAWAAAVGLADVSNVALLYRLRRCGDWLALLVGQALAASAPAAAGPGRLIRIVDATTVKAGGASKRGEQWRVHAAFDLPGERFGCFELTDAGGGERLDRFAVVEGEIRIADRAYLQPERMAAVLAAGADLVVRAGWRNARWLAPDDTPLDLIAEFRKARCGGLIDRPVLIARKEGRPPLALRLIAVRKPKEQAEAARRKARREAQRGGHQVSQGTLEAADWVILVTSLKADNFSSHDVLALYRLRWRIELAFKRLKSVVGLKPPPGSDERSARPWLLAHLLAILLLEPLVDGFEDSPRWAHAA